MTETGWEHADRAYGVFWECRDSAACLVRLADSAARRARRVLEFRDGPRAGYQIDEPREFVLRQVDKAWRAILAHQHGQEDDTKRAVSAAEWMLLLSKKVAYIRKEEMVMFATQGQPEFYEVGINKDGETE